MGLREQHRLDTRRRIADAAFALAQSTSEVRPDAIAERAGISRRTLFNYVPSADAALSLPVEDYLEDAIERFRERPADEDVFTAFVEAVSSIDASVVLRLERFVTLQQRHPDEAGARHYLLVWEHSEMRVREALAERLGKRADPLFVAALAGALMGAGKAAVSMWAALPRRPSEHRSKRPPLTSIFVRTLEYLAQTPLRQRAR